jgi:acetyltransferase
MHARGSLAPLVSPRSIAILGASSDFSKINGRPLKHLLEKGYAGALYPVNPKYTAIGELKCWPSVAAIPGPVDLAIIALPAKEVIAAVRGLGAKRVPAAVIFSSGFGEMGEAGKALERALVEEAAGGGVRICGPNCLGFVNAFERVIATFSQYADAETPAGPVGFVSQSGAFGTAIAALARGRGTGLGYFINTGNECDIGFPEAMRHVIDDPRIRVGAGYIEGLKDGAGLVELAAHAMALGKPLVVTKVGRLGAGSRAAASHTGALAGEDRVFDAVVQQYGILRARNEEQLLDLLEVLAACALPQGRGLGLITQSGGAGVLMADRAEELGLEVPALAPATQQALLGVIPGFGAAGNPVDVTGQFVAQPDLLRESVRIVLDDPGVHVGIVWLQLMQAHVETLARLFAEIKAQARKPFVVAWVAAPEAGVRRLRELGIPVLRGAEPAVDAVAGLVRYAEARGRWLEDAGVRAGAQLPALQLPAGKGVVATADAVRLLSGAGVPMAPVRFAPDAQAAASAAQALGFPVAVKIESPDILHKTEAKGVALGLGTPEEVRAAFGDVVANARACNAAARIGGVIVQKMAGAGVELAIGLQQDPSFGPVVMAGLGGVFVEVLRDASFRRCPVTPGEAGAMLDELRGAAMLGAVRGRAAVNRTALVQAIVAVSRFGAAAGPRLAELDLNPVLADAGGALAVDAVLVLN